MIVFNKLSDKFMFDKKVAYTLVEAIITIGIIGVVAALTISSLVKNYQKKVIVNSLKVDFALLQDVIDRSSVDNFGHMFFNYSLSASNFFQKYFAPYLNVIETLPRTDERTFVYTSDGQYGRTKVGFNTDYGSSSDYYIHK